MREVRIVNRGIDTLVVNMYHTDRGRPVWCDIDATIALQLDEPLLRWDLAGSALAYADEDRLVALLTGRKQTNENLFTLTLYRFIISNGRFPAIMKEKLCAVPHAYSYVDVMMDWFREPID